MAIQIASTRIAQANAFAARVERVALCTGSPGTGTTPANEVVGGSYARKTPVWATATDNGTVATAAAAELEFDVPSGTTVTHVAYLTAAGNTVDWVDSADIAFTTTAGKVRVTPKHTVT